MRLGHACSMQLSYEDENGAFGRIPTGDTLLRRQVLYATELRRR